jgi:hypothetical protein
MKRLIKRNKNISGIVWDSPEECLADVPDAVILHGKEDARNKAKEGDYYRYKDGVTAQIRKIRRIAKGREVVIKTVLNEFMGIHADDVPGEYLNYAAWSKNAEIDLDAVDEKKVKFIEAWLLRGMQLEKAFYKYFYSYLSKKLNTKGGAHKDLRREAYIFLSSGTWFEKLMAENKVVKDKYSNLVGALEAAGINQDFIATKIKEFMESGDTKLQVAGLNKAIELLMLEEKKKFLLHAGKPINQLPSFLATVDDEEAHLLSGRNGNDASTKEVNQPDQVESLQQGKAKGSNGRHLTEQDTPEQSPTHDEKYPSSESEINVDEFLDGKGIEEASREASEDWK